MLAIKDVQLEWIGKDGQGRKYGNVKWPDQGPMTTVEIEKIGGVYVAKANGLECARSTRLYESEDNLIRWLRKQIL